LPRPTTFVKIPKDRIGALIGQGGIIKERIEKQLDVEIDVDSETGDVNLNLSPNAEDPSLMFRAKELITAIGKGFAPERAFRLIQDDEALLEVIDLREIFGRSSSELQRVKGRIIGQKGKTRRIIEELTDAEVSIYGHTVTIIANADEMDITREAVKMLLQGRQHNSVYRFLNKKRRELEKKKLELWKKTPEELEK
jgi:ribosomal RNA assembly protein